MIWQKSDLIKFIVLSLQSCFKIDDYACIVRSTRVSMCVFSNNIQLQECKHREGGGLQEESGKTLENIRKGVISSRNHHKSWTLN